MSDDVQVNVKNVLNGAVRLREFDDMEPAEQIKYLKSLVDSAHETIRRLGSEVMALRRHQHGPTGQCLVPMRDRYIPNERDW
jgi:hypothetical protein